MRIRQSEARRFMMGRGENQKLEVCGPCKMRCLSGEGCEYEYRIPSILRSMVCWQRSSCNYCVHRAGTLSLFDAEHPSVRE